MMDLDGTTSASALAGGATASTDTAAGATDSRSDGADTMEVATGTTAGAVTKKKKKNRQSKARRGKSHNE